MRHQAVARSFSLTRNISVDEKDISHESWPVYIYVCAVSFCIKNNGRQLQLEQFKKSRTCHFIYFVFNTFIHIDKKSITSYLDFDNNCISRGLFRRFSHFMIMSVGWCDVLFSFSMAIDACRCSLGLLRFVVVFCVSLSVLMAVDACRCRVLRCVSIIFVFECAIFFSCTFSIGVGCRFRDLKFWCFNKFVKPNSISPNALIQSCLHEYFCFHMSTFGSVNLVMRWFSKFSPLREIRNFIFEKKSNH